MELMKPAIEFQMLSKLQKYWGGSHDVVLGMMLWLFDLPVIPLHSLMHYCPITYNIIASGALQADRKFKQKLLYHKVSSCAHTFDLALHKVHDLSTLLL
jgi:hypothetical protein